MKNRHFLRLPLLFSLILLISSCGLDSMVSKFNTLNFTVTPTQVEVHGGNIEIEQVKIPENIFKKCRSNSNMLAQSADSGQSFFEPVNFKEKKFLAMVRLSTM